MSFTFPVLLTAAGCGTWFPSHRNTDSRSVHLGALGRNQATALDLLTWWTGGPLSLGKTSVHLATTAPHHTTVLSGAEPGFKSTLNEAMGSRLCFGMRRRPFTISLRTPRRILCLGQKNWPFVGRKEAGERRFKAAVHVLTSFLGDRFVW